MKNTIPKKPLISEHISYEFDSLAIKRLRASTALDLAFQSEERWDDFKKTNFITSLITGMAPSKIVIANIDACIENLNPLDDEYKDDLKYFESWKGLGFKSISIDGNNRTITIDEYLNNKVTIMHGEYILSNGSVAVIDETNDTFGKHPQELINHIEANVVISVEEYKNCTRADLTLLFLNINDGMTLNQQEKRNAILVDFSKWVRKTTKLHYDNMLKKVFPTDKAKARRVIDEYIVAMAIYAVKGAKVSIQAAEKNKAYETKSPLNSSVVMKKVDNMISNFAKFVKKNVDNKMKNHSTLFNLFMVYKHIMDNDYVIRDEEKFYTWFMASENKRLGNTKPIMTTKSGDQRTFASCNNTMSSPELKARLKYLVEDLNDKMNEIIFVKDSQRLFTNAQRYQMWVNQNGFCSETGKEIPESEINDDSKWAADHITPFSKGGSTTVENGQLICKQANLKKSNKLQKVA
tara:strand:+ start:112 stop:1503 length:1392 start_codon:yes stop_codon:yes gene_type:complete